MAADLKPARRNRNYGFRFGVAYFFLAAVLGASVGTFIVLLGRHGSSNAEWSAWAPNGNPDERVDKIKDHVATKYRLPSGNQLVGVLAQTPSVVRDGQQVPIRGYGLATPGPVSGQPNVTFTPTDGSIEYILCGIATKDCSIGEDKPSAARLRLLKREALELALYTFRYVDDVKSVFALLPPQPGQQPSFGLYFRKSDLKDELDHPLRRTLPQDAPPLGEGMSAIERSVVDRLTADHFYKFQYQPIADGSVVLLLQRAA